MFTKKNARQAYNGSAWKQDADGLWAALRAAVKYTGWSRDILLKAKNEGTALLGGKCPRTRPFRDGYGRLTDYFWKNHLDTMRDAKSDLVTNPAEVNVVPYGEAAADLGVSERELRKLLKKIGVSPEKQLGKDSIGKLCHRSVVPKAAVKKLKTQRAARVPADGRMTISQIAKRLDISPTQASRMVHEGTVYLNGEKLVPDVKTVEDVAQRMTGEASVIDQDGKSCSSEKLALKNYRHACLQTLRRYRNKPCPQLGGGILHACQKAKTGIKANRWGEPWFYRDEDLERLRPPLKPGKHMTAGRGGRPRDPQKKKACEFCYRQLAQGRDPKAILEAAQARFKRSIRVKEFAKLYALRNSRTWPLALGTSPSDRDADSHNGHVREMRSAPIPKEKRKRGRQPGSTLPGADALRERIIKDHKAEKFNSVADLAKAHGVSRSRASQIIHGHA